MVAGKEEGVSAERMSDVFSESRASWLAEGFENAAPAWPAKRAPALTSVQSVSFDSLVPTPSPFGPTFGCSFSHLPPCSIVVQTMIMLSMILPNSNLTFNLPRLARAVSFVLPQKGLNFHRTIKEISKLSNPRFLSL